MDTEQLLKEGQKAAGQVSTAAERVMAAHAAYLGVAISGSQVAALKAAHQWRLEAALTMNVVMGAIALQTAIYNLSLDMTAEEKSSLQLQPDREREDLGRMAKVMAEVTESLQGALRAIRANSTSPLN
jgi:hypothetical protein